MIWDLWMKILTLATMTTPSAGIKGMDIDGDSFFVIQPFR